MGFTKRDLNAAFRLFAAEESNYGRILRVDELLILQHLLHNPEIDVSRASALCQLSEPRIRERLSSMESAGHLEHGGKGRRSYGCIHPDLYNRLAESDQGAVRRRINWEAAKTRVFSILMERARRSEPGLSNKEIRQITRFDRNQVLRLMTELRQENPDIQPPGRGKYARYELKPVDTNSE